MTGLLKIALLILLVTLFLVVEAILSRKQIFKITAYCGCKLCCGEWHGITKTGKKLEEGMCAVDIRVIPLHSTVYIKGVGVFKAEDVGGKVNGKEIDIYIPNHRAAKAFGVKHSEVRFRRVR